MEKIPLLGTIVNIAAVIAGSILGRFMGHLVPEKMHRTTVLGLGLAVILLGLKLAFQTNQPLVLIGSLILGGIIGEALRIEGRLENFGAKLQERFAGSGNVAEAFVASSLLYCVGAMAVMGSIQDGLGGTPTILYAKAALDGTASVVLVTTMGIGVIFSVIPIFLYQGALTLAAVSVQGLLTEPVISEMNAVGGLIIFSIGLDLLGIKKLPVGNFLPAIFVAMGIMVVMGIV